MLFTIDIAELVISIRELTQFIEEFKKDKHESPQNDDDNSHWHHASKRKEYKRVQPYKEDSIKLENSKEEMYDSDANHQNEKNEEELKDKNIHLKKPSKTLNMIQQTSLIQKSKNKVNFINKLE